MVRRNRCSNVFISSSRALEDEMSKGVTVLANLRARPNMAAVAHRELIIIIAKIVATEPACLSIRLHQDVDDETRFFLCERWTSREAYTRLHMQASHVQAFLERAPAFLDGPPSITFWDVLDDQHATFESSCAPLRQPAISVGIDFARKC
jgi:quinol monooxygenase YgiN